MTRYELETVEISDEASARVEIHRRLREVGLLIDPKGPPVELPAETFEPFQAPGATLSEIVKEERQER